MTTDFSFVSKQAYTAPAYNAVNFVFGQVNDTGLAEITGASTVTLSAYGDASFNFNIPGVASHTFDNSSYGTLERTVSFAGTSAVDIKVVAYQSGDTTISSVATENYPTQKFAGGTLSLYQTYGGDSFHTQSFGAGLAEISASVGWSFEAYYDFNASGSASFSLSVGARSDHVASSSGITTDAFISSKLVQTVAWSVGSVNLLPLATRLRSTELIFSGIATDAQIGASVAPSEATLNNAATTNLVFGGVFGTQLSTVSLGVFVPSSSAYVLSSMSLYVSGELVYYAGGIKSSPFSGAGSVTLYDPTEILRQGGTEIIDATGSATFDAATRIQGLRYTQVYVAPLREPTQYLFTSTAQVPVYTDEITTITISKSEDILCYSGDDTIRVLPGEVVVVTTL